MHQEHQKVTLVFMQSTCQFLILTRLKFSEQILVKATTKYFTKEKGNG